MSSWEQVNWQPPIKLDVTDAAGAKKTYEAKHIILATGARSRELPNIKIDNKKISGYRDAMATALLNPNR